MMSRLLLLFVLPSLIHCSWTDWSEWSKCSTTCDSGVSSKQRECLSQNCTGPSRLYKTCRPTKVCSLNHSYTFRDQLCSSMNKMYMKHGQYLKWIAARNKENSNGCSLVCKSGYYVLPLRTGVSMNGAKCKRSSSGEEGVCLGKYCAPTGCNRVLGTSNSLSKCLHCPSYLEYKSNLQCKQFTLALGRPASRGDKLAAVIPRDSTTITITFQRDTNIVLRTAQTSLSIPITDNTLPFTISGSTFILHSNYTVYTTGPLNEDITIMVEPKEGENAVDDSTSSIQYYKLVNETSLVKNESIYSWQYGDYSECSATCGIGIEVAHVHCRDSEFPDNMLPDSFCSQMNEMKPFPIVRKCSKTSCPPRWKIYEWGQCNAVCEGGTQTRTVKCIKSDQNGNDEIISSELCENTTRPMDSRECNTHTCGLWSVTEWSACSLNCGDGGNQSRNVTCLDSNKRILDDVNCHHPKPPLIKPCNNGQCHYLWNISTWSQCSTGCGNGIQYRSVTCQNHLRENVNDSLCRLTLSPVRNRDCFSTKTCNKLWVMSPWSQCEGECGLSHQIRNVTCRAIIGNTAHIVNDVACNDTAKPSDKRDCNKTGCVYWKTEEWGQCTHSCGGGTQTRNITCAVLSTGQPTGGCDESSQPPNSRTCNTNECPIVCSDHRALNCTAMIIQTPDLCSYTYLRSLCCETCSSST